MLTFFIAFFLLLSRQQSPLSKVDDTSALKIQTQDTQLKNTLSLVLTGVVSYQANNRGQQPDNWSSFTKTYLPDVTGYTFISNNEAAISSPQKKTVYYSAGYVCSSIAGEVTKGVKRDIAVRAMLSNNSVTCQDNN